MVRIANKQIDLLQIANDIENASYDDDEVGCSILVVVVHKKNYYKMLFLNYPLTNQTTNII